MLNLDIFYLPKFIAENKCAHNGDQIGDSPRERKKVLLLLSTFLVTRKQPVELYCGPQLILLEARESKNG